VFRSTERQRRRWHGIKNKNGQRRKDIADLSSLAESQSFIAEAAGSKIGIAGGWTKGPVHP
jgi:hypothetical protein